MCAEKLEKYPFARGSEWRRWDLHFHTPSSYDYDNVSVTNEEIIAKLKECNISVVAITDHHVMDVDRIKKLQDLGLQNDITVLPGIEFCGESRGRDPIHFVGIFSESSDVDYVWSEINSKSNIASQRQEGKRDNEIHCKLEDTCQLIKKTGGVVSIHAGSKTNTVENITNSLPVGMAEKRDIVKSIDIYELGKIDDKEGYEEKVFPSLKKIIPMIMCSDNHNISNYSVKEKCWIKADPNFEGLKQIIYEPEDRVYIGLKPNIIERVRLNKTKYIKSLKINQKSGYNEKNGIWFKNVDINFNKELVAIIGNKGSGKSALSDIIGLLGHTHNAGKDQIYLSFLNGKIKRFRKSGFAENFEAKLIWEDGSGIETAISLDNNVNINEPEKVKYLPQNHFETLTNDIDGKGFSSTLKSVIFLHISDEERLGHATFDELEDDKVKNIKSDIIDLCEELSSISKKIIEIENKRHPDYKEKLDNLITEKEREFNEHEKNKPKEIKDPSKDKSSEVDVGKKGLYKKLEELNVRYKKITDLIDKNQGELNVYTKNKEELSQIKGEILKHEKQISNYITLNKEKLNKYQLVVEEIISIEFNLSTLNKKITDINIEIVKLENTLKDRVIIDSDFILSDNARESAYKTSLYIQQENLQEEIDKIKNDLSKPERDYQEYVEKLSQWQLRKNIIEGTEEKLNSLNFYKVEKKFIDEELETKLTDLRKDRIKKAIEIFNKKKEVINLYNSFKESIDKQINKDKNFTYKIKMDIEAGFKVSSDFASRFLGFINRSRSGTFRGAEEKQVKELFIDKDLLKKDDIEDVLNTIILYLEEDQDNKNKRHISDQIDKMLQFYDYVFSLEYLDPIYELKLDNKTLEELSPGEKGALLLVFYLMIDREDIPLIIDQPEDNLDNKSVFQVLTHFIKNAKKRRQIIIITHNPNLAVGADAEQIIYVELNKNKKYEFKYEMGAIENPMVNKRIVEILEGTMPAFDKRKLKYFR